MRTIPWPQHGSVGGLLALVFSLGLLINSGCAENGGIEHHERASFARGESPTARLAPISAAEPPQAAAAGAVALVSGQAAPPADRPQALANRKIIYNTAVDLVTDDLNKLEAGLTSLIQSRGAYVADSARSGSAGSTRHGTWKVRVPVDAYDSFVRGVIALGELVSSQAQSQDVSAEYYDLDARTNAKKVEEARLLKHLSDSTGRLDEILTVERELTRVRSEIEQMQGRLNVLSNLTALATVTLTASEIKQVAQPPALDPTFAQRVATTFNGSVATLRDLGEAILLFLVAVAPWLPVLIPALVLVILAVRRINGFVASTGFMGSPPRPS